MKFPLAICLADGTTHPQRRLSTPDGAEGLRPLLGYRNSLRRPQGRKLQVRGDSLPRLSRAQQADGTACHRLPPGQCALAAPEEAARAVHGRREKSWFRLCLDFLRRLCLDFALHRTELRHALRLLSQHRIVVYPNTGKQTASTALNIATKSRRIAY